MMLTRACLMFLAGVMAPQLSSFARLPDHFPDAIYTSEQPLLVLGIFGLPALLLWLLPSQWRRDACCVLAGVALFLVHASLMIDARLAPGLAGDSILTTVRIDDFPSVSGDAYSFVASAESDPRIPARVRLSWFEPPVSLRIGDVWRVELRLDPPRGNSNPGTMDYEAWAFRERLGAAGYVVSGKHNRLLDSDTSRGIALLREHFVSRVLKLVPEREVAAVVVALVVGARHLVSNEQWDRYARTGTSHLMAISGLHIGLAAAGSYLLASLLFGLAGGQSNHHDRAMLIALIVAGLYAALSGFAVPARRATLMLALATAIVLWRRQVNACTVLVATAALISVADPLTTLAPGFQLSFAAVAVLLWLARRSAAHGASGRLQPLHMLQSLAGLQLALLFGLLPLTVLNFDRVSLAAPAINLLAVPLFTLITVPFALLGLLLDGVAVAPGDWLLRLSAGTIVGLEYLLVWLAADERSAHTIAARQGIAWLCLFLPLVWVLLPARWPGRFSAWAGFLALLVYRPPSPPEGCVDITMLDVGQGLAAVLRTREHVALYDSGPAWRSGGSAGERIVLPYLRSQGISALDRVVISHSDLDHAGGLQAILEAIPAQRLESGDALPWIERHQSRCEAQDSWLWNGVRFDYLHPPVGHALERNDASCVLLVEAGQQRYLLTGDIEAAVETRLIQARILPEVNVVSVPHHGSQTSSLVPFIRSVNSGYALVSAAHRNQWGFPKENIVARWEGAGARVLNTATSGAIRVRMCVAGHGIELWEYRETAHRLWHADN